MYATTCAGSLEHAQMRRGLFWAGRDCRHGREEQGSEQRIELGSAVGRAESRLGKRSEFVDTVAGSKRAKADVYLDGAWDRSDGRNR